MLHQLKPRLLVSRELVHVVGAMIKGCFTSYEGFNVHGFLAFHLIGNVILHTHFAGHLLAVLNLVMPTQRTAIIEEHAAWLSRPWLISVEQQFSMKLVFVLRNLCQM
jgi:hypothetical protein